MVGNKIIKDVIVKIYESLWAKTEKFGHFLIYFQLSGLASLKHSNNTFKKFL